MVSTFTANVQLEEPARGDQVGTWDTPVNSNMTLIDLLVGGVSGIALAGAPVVLAAAQFQSKTLIFTSTLTANVSITFPTSFTKSYEIINACTGSSAFTITLTSTSAGVQAICAPPGEAVDIVHSSPGVFLYKNIGRIGQYWDHGGSSVPNWVSGCTVAPYLLCDGTAFSSATFPNLRNYLGVATTPDARGRARFALDGGTARNTGVVAGNTILTGGGDQYLMSHTHANTLTDPGHTHATNAQTGTVVVTAGGAAAGGLLGSSISPVVTGVTINNVAFGAGGSGMQNLPPLYISGITLIRAG